MQFNRPQLDKALLRNNGIARRFVVALVLFSSAITAVITAVELYRDYRLDIQGIDERIESIRAVYLPTLTESVWVAERSLIQSQLDGLLHLGDVEHLAIEVDGKTKWSAGSRKSQHRIEKRITLIRTYRGRGVVIGELHVVASVDNVLDRLWSKLLVMLVSNGIKTVLVMVFALILFQAMVGRHLEHLSAHLRRVGTNPADMGELRLRRAETGRWRPDALDHVSHAVNAMQQDIRVSHASLMQSEASLRRFRLAMDAAADAISLVDRASMRYIDVNAAACAMVGRTREEILALGPDGVMSISRAELECIYDDVIAGGAEVESVERLQQRKDGTEAWLEIRRRAQRLGENWIIVTVANDITERKRGEAQRRLAASVFENAAEGILVTDKDNNILTVNRAVTEITGYTAEEAIGMNPRMMKSGLQSGAFYRAMWAAIAETGRWRGELWDRRKDGQLFCELLSIVAVRDEAGEITHYCAIFSDITKLKTAEAELNALNEQLEDRIAQGTANLESANSELQAFSYSVSHDLQAPLRHINGYSTIVLRENEGKLDAATVNYLKRINAASERMGMLIQDLLNLSRVSRQELKKQPVDLSAVAGDVVDSLVRAHPERKVRVTVAPQMKVEGDPGLVRIALENLIGNAWKFTSRANQPGIDIGIEQRGGETIYHVRDNGAGFDMKYAGKLFAPFHRLHSEREFQGTGIGLSIVQRIVARHGGRIWVESTEGEGASFYFTLGKSEPQAGRDLPPA